MPKTVDQPFASLGLIRNPKPNRLASVGSTPAALNVTPSLKTMVIVLRKPNQTLKVEVSDNGEDTQDLYRQDKYPDHLGEAAIEMMKKAESPYYNQIYSGLVLDLKQQHNGDFRPSLNHEVEPLVRVGETVAFEDEDRFDS